MLQELILPNNDVLRDAVSCDSHIPRGVTVDEHHQRVSPAQTAYEFDDSAAHLSLDCLVYVGITKVGLMYLALLTKLPLGETLSSLV